MIYIDKVLKKQRLWQALSSAEQPVMRAMAIDALAICADAVAVLSDNLKSIGYIWVSTERIPVDTLEAGVQLIETNAGLRVPEVLVCFWQLVGGISFVDLEEYRHVEFWHEHHISAPKGFSDGLHVDACNREWAEFVCQDYEDWRAYQRQDEKDKFLLALSPDGYHKDNISGGAPYGVFAEPGWKPAWQYFEWSGSARPVTALADPPDFLSYLRTAVLECAGFPGLLGVPAYEKIRDKLLQGVPVF